MFPFCLHYFEMGGGEEREAVAGFQQRGKHW